MNYLVASTRHHLLPLHHRLRREGQNTEALVWRSRYEKAWDGSIAPLARHSDGSLHSEALNGHVGAAQRGELTVVTDVRRVAALFAAAPRLFPALGTQPAEPHRSPRDHVLFGGWFGGEAVHLPHLLVADWGAWGAGMGLPVLGGVTLVRLGQWPDLVKEPATLVVDHLKRASFKGLFHFDLEENPATGDMELAGLEAGWPWLHTQAFLAELRSLSDLLGGNTPKGTLAGEDLTKRFVTVLPISVPPWPSEKTQQLEAGVPINGLTAKQQGQLFWFDIEVDREANKLRTAGLDGLLAVAVGSSNSTPLLARLKALELAGQLDVPGKQWRSDTGGQVESVLATLEDRWAFSALA